MYVIAKSICFFQKYDFSYHLTLVYPADTEKMYMIFPKSPYII